MAVHREQFSKIPSDAIILSEDDALQYQINIIQKWKKTSDTWAFKHGYTILASMSALTAVYINNHYRVKFRLQDLGRFSSYLPVVVLPSLVSAIFHQQFIVTDVLMQKSCPVCVQVRAATMQCVLGTIFPAVIAPLAALPFAIRYMTYNVPLITKEPMKVLNMMYRHTKPIGNTLLGILAFQGLVAALLTHQEAKSFYNIQSKLNELEHKLEEEYVNVIQS